MPSLRDLQCAVRRSVVEHDDAAIVRHILGGGLAPAQRVAIHRNTFEGNLANALRLSFPAVHRLVGAEFFAGAACLFVHQRPPGSAWLDEYGAAFPGFLAEFPPAASLPYLADVARLEWAVTRALHAPDAAPLDAQELAALDPADHERVRFIADPALFLLRVASPADTIWRAVLAQDDAALAAIDPASGTRWLLIERRHTGVAVSPLDEQAWQLLNALVGGLPLGTALEVTAGPESATRLAEHIGAGRFVGFSLVDPTHPSVVLENVS